MLHLTALDYLAAGLFICFVLFLGLSTKLKENTMVQFLLAGRSLTLPVYVAAIVSSWYGGVLGIGEAITSFGVGTFTVLSIPYYFSALLYAFVFAKRIRHSKQISIPERLSLRFGPKTGFFGSLLIFLIAIPAAHLLMMATLIQFLTGWDIALCLFFSATLCSFFLYKGGMFADARLSIMACVMTFIGFIGILATCLWTHPLTQTLSNIEKPLLSLDGGIGWTGIISFALLAVWTLVDPTFHQKAASASTEKISKQGLIISVTIWVIFDLMVLGIGIYGIALIPQPLANPIALLPMMGDLYLPSGIKAIYLCGLIGTTLTAVVGYTLVSGSTFGKEIICQIWKKPEESTKIFWSRIGIIVSSLIGITLALTMKSVVALWFAWAGCIVGSILLPVCLSYLKKQFNYLTSATVLTSLVTSFVVSFAWMLYAKTTHNDNFEIRLSNGITFSIGTVLPGLVVSSSVLGVGTLLSMAKSRKKDSEFGLGPRYPATHEFFPLADASSPIES